MSTCLTLFTSCSVHVPVYIHPIAAMKDNYTLLVAMFACIGTFLYGFDTGIATTSTTPPNLVLRQEF